MNQADACVELLRPKTVPEGLIAIGTVAQVSEIQIKLQITGGIVCFVDRFNVSRSYTKLVEIYNKSPQEASEPPRLSQIFKRGEQYVCKILERRKRKGYAEAEDIIATLDPTAIQEDNVANSYLSIPQIPIQCSVESVEDHGYLMDIGFPGLTGFMPFDEVKEGQSKLVVGQILRCCLKKAMKPDDESRIVQLALNEADMKNSHFTFDKVQQNVLNARSFLPGTRSFLTVMKIVKNGLIVNFANEFPGFVSIFHLKEEWHLPKKDYKISDQIACTVLYYNSITNLFALSLKPWDKYEATLAHFITNYHVGQVIKKAKVAYIDGTRAVTFRIENKYKAIANVKDALDADIGTMNRDEISSALDETYPDESAHSCRIKALNLADLVIVLSLRSEFMKLPFVSVEELKPADFIEATVKKYVKDGVVVSYGLNLRAIILNVDLNDYISTKSYKKYPVGKKVKCRVLKVDFTKQPPRVYLTNKDELMDKNMTVVQAYDKSLKGKTTHASVIKIKPDGLIVEMFNNVKGYIPRRFLSSAPVKSVADLYEVGQVIQCTIYRIDPSWPSLLLGVLPYDVIVKMKSERKLAQTKRKDLKDLEMTDRALKNKIERSKVKVKNSDEAVPKANSHRSKDLMKPRELPSEEVEWDSDDSIIEINPNDRKNRKRNLSGNRESSQIAKRFKFIPVGSGINWSADFSKKDSVAPDDQQVPIESDVESSSDTSSDTQLSHSSAGSLGDSNKATVQKSRRQRSEEAKLREERLREAENKLLDGDRHPQTIPDFERLVLKTPNAADAWIKYSKYFLDNVETEKARIVCRRALRTISFRLEKEKLKVWLHLIKIEAKFGGNDQLKTIIEEASQTNDKMALYQGCAKVLINCGNLDDAERMHELMLKLDGQSIEVWLGLIQFYMEHRKMPEKARSLYDKACKSLTKSSLVQFKSRFAQIEFKTGDVERGKTLFENLMSDNPKRTDLWRVYESMIKKFGTRQVDSIEIREQNEQLLHRIRENIGLVSKKSKKLTQ